MMAKRQSSLFRSQSPGDRSDACSDLKFSFSYPHGLDITERFSCMPDTFFVVLCRG